MARREERGRGGPPLCADSKSVGDQRQRHGGDGKKLRERPFRLFILRLAQEFGEPDADAFLGRLSARQIMEWMVCKKIEDDQQRKASLSSTAHECLTMGLRRTR